MSAQTKGFITDAHDYKGYYDSIGSDLNYIEGIYDTIVANYLGPTTKHEKVLDIGCGNGRIIHVLYQNGYTTYGMDISKGAIERAKKLNPEFADNIYELSIEEIPATWKETFDYVICNEVLEHLLSPYLSFQNILQVLKPGGKILYSTPNTHYLARIMVPNCIVPEDLINKHINTFDLAQWKILTTLTQLTILKVIGFGPAFPRMKGIGRLLDHLPKLNRFKKNLLVIGEKGGETKT